MGEIVVRGPEDSLKRRDSIHVGSIFKMEFTPSEGVKPKNPGETSRIKYFVIIGIDGDRVFVGALLINSRINDRLFSRIGPYQHRIEGAEYSYMTKEESYINCYEIKEIDARAIIAKAEYVGELLAADLTAARALVKKSPSIKPATLKKFHLK